MKLPISLSFVLSISTISLASNPIVSRAFVDSINQMKPSWIAGRNFLENTTAEYLRKIASGSFDNLDAVNVKSISRKISGAIPADFDARIEWPNCESIKEIRDQGSCGSCWAFGAAEAMTDRICIATNGTTKFQFSPEDLLTCCSNCGDCNGGYSRRAWEYWRDEGIVSGGDQGSNQGCKPYSDNSYVNGVASMCDKTCRLDYSTSYRNDIHKGFSYYSVEPTVEQIQNEIMTNGPVEGFMDVYEDLYTYQSGVYQHVTGSKVGQHAIKIIGWGVEQKLSYWLIANSWGTAWGDEGFFKILRGKNHARIETAIDAGSFNASTKTQPTFIVLVLSALVFLKFD